MKERVQKWIAHSGLCSRRKAEELIGQGKVKVNGEIISLGDKCLEKDSITVNGIPLSKKQDFVYYVLNKPKGVVCSHEDKFNKETIFDILPKVSGLTFAGRLDKDTTGLLIVTNDKEFVQEIIHPSKKIAKEYFFKLNKELKMQDKEKLERGIVLDSYKLKPCKIKEETIEIYEGRKRQIRRIFEETGYRVVELERIRIGELKLNTLEIKKGEYKEVTKEFIQKQL